VAINAGGFAVLASDYSEKYGIEVVELTKEPGYLGHLSFLLLH
jgi:acyl-CoA synthetase (NDP forming)